MDPETTFSAVTALTTAGSDVASQLMDILGVIVPVAIGVVAAKLGVTKGIGIIKTLFGKA